MRRYFIGLVPNRYFELSLTLLDRLGEAIGKYLRGALIECFLVIFAVPTVVVVKTAVETLFKELRDYRMI